MKVVAAERPHHHRAAGILGVKKDNKCSIMKPAHIEFRGEKFTLSDEMKECFIKLSDMVPDVPRNDKGVIDGTVLMQYVIDYILDLELQLDGHYNFSTAVAFSNSLQSRLAAVESAQQQSREPLSEKSIENVTAQLLSSSSSPCPNTCLSPSDCDLRPPSK